MRSVVVLWLAVLLAVLPGSARAAPGAAEQVARLGRGVNVLGYDPIWKDPARARFTPKLYGVIRAGGFSHIRLNLHAFAHMDSQNRLAPAFLAQLDDIVRRATEAGLMVILDEHDFRACGEDAVSCRTKLIAFWEQIAPRFRDAPDSVMFEILNEPNRALTPDLWAQLSAEALAVIRKTNPARTVVIGPPNFNSFKALDLLRLPEADRNIIVTVHYYNPFPFTHQGAKWTTPSREDKLGVAWGSAADRAEVEREFDTVARWSRSHDRPIFIGEFGAYDKADMAMRVAWTAAVARAAERRGFAWSYWQFDSNFVVYDIPADRWVQPIHDALIPPR